MTVQKILKELGLTENKYSRKHSSALKNIHAFLKENRALITGVEIGAGTVQFGRETEHYKKTWRSIAEIQVNNEGEKMEGYKIAITTQTGCYSFILPKNAALYNWFNEVIELPALGMPANQVQGEGFTMDARIVEALKKASAFVDKDKKSLRPNLQCVCIDVKDGRCKVIASNGFYLFVSQELECNYTGGERQILICGADLKGLKPVKADKVNAVITGNNIAIEGNSFEIQPLKYVNYMQVMPVYNQRMNFNVDQLTKAIKAVEPFANKFTKQIKFHLNGNINLYAEDQDFQQCNTTEIPYNLKEFPDMDINFNGQYLRTCLAAFKEQNLDMYSAGNEDKGVIISNGLDQVLLLPLMPY